MEKESKLESKLEVVTLMVTTFGLGKVSKVAITSNLTV